MAHSQGLVALALLLSSASSQAFFNDLAAPPNWTHSNGTAGTYRAAATDVSYAGGVRGSPATLNLGGRAITVPVAYKYAANASKVAAVLAFANPALLLLSTAAVAYSWYVDSGYEIKNGIWTKKVTTGCASNCIEYWAGGAVPKVWHATKLPACTQAMEHADLLDTSTYIFYGSRIIVQGHCSYFRRLPHQLPENGTEFNATFETRTAAPTPVTITYVPITVEEFQTQMEPKVMPTGVPQKLPFSLPIDPPILNPSAAPVPLPQPMRIPQGTPQAVPNTSPQQYKTPVVDVTPTTTISSPWRTDVVPKDIVSTSPTPLPDLDTPPSTTPTGTTVTASISPDLCATNPEILACQKIKLEVPDPDDITKQDKSITFSKDTGWGGTGSCPAPRHLQSVNVDFKFDMVCDFMTGIRPVAIAIAWFIGGLILLGSRGGAD